VFSFVQVTALVQAYILLLHTVYSYTVTFDISHQLTKLFVRFNLAKEITLQTCHHTTISA